MLQKITGLTLVISALTTAAAAQGIETLGSRAAGIAAFVAVADDASAVAWNPAGLVTGPLFNISLDFGRLRSEPDGEPAPPGVAGRVHSNLIALGVLPFGVSYYRLASRSATAVGPEVLGNSGRQEQQVIVRSLVTTHVGATVLQSLGDYVTVGTTVKFVRGNVGAAAGRTTSWDDAVEAAEGIETGGSTRGDLDVGAMFAVGAFRAGLVVRNVTEPSFEDDDGNNKRSLERHARAGVAWADGWPGMARTIVAFDADLTRVPHVSGDRRDMAVGIEHWTYGHRVGVRGGLRASTIDAARPVASGGGSFALRPGVYVDGYFAHGRAEDRAWGLAVRLTY